MLTTYRETVTKLQGKLEHLTEMREDHQSDFQEASDRLKIVEQAAVIIKAAANATQDQVNYKLSSVVTMALQAVFHDNPYEFIANFEPRRGTIECDLMFQRNGEQINPLDDSGYSTADIASFALRVAFQSMSDTRDLIVIDEPCKNLSEGYKDPAANMFKESAQKRGIQFIVVTHIPAFREAADKLFWVKMDRKVVSTIN